MRPLVSTLIVGAVVATAALSTAQNRRISIQGSGGFGLTSAYARLYDPATIVTFAGRITGITVASPMQGAGNSVRLVVKAKNGGSSLVELGPQWYVNNQRVKLHLKDRVTVYGSKVMLDGRGSIMASRVLKGRQTLVLRDNSGRPYWSAVLAVTPSAVNSQGSSAQQIMAQQATRRIPLMPYDSNQTVFANPTQVNGTISNLGVNNGQVFATVTLGGGEAQTVYLGPLWYLERQDFTISPGDTVMISELTPIPNPNHIVYAQRLSENGSTIVLRDDTGQMMWQPFVPTTIRP
jgi:hypothetical protein